MALGWLGSHLALIGLGVSACGTSLLALMAKRVPDERRAPAATTVWLMMIVGFAVTAGVVGKLIDPYSPQVHAASLGTGCSLGHGLHHGAYVCGAWKKMATLQSL